MEDQSSTPVIKGKISSILRYPLRSATKSKKEKASTPESSNPSALKRGLPVSTVNKSVSILNLSGKDKSTKPPGRFSISANSVVSPLSRSLGNITLISETRAKRAGTEVKNDSPVSDIYRLSSRKTFSAMSSASYWLSQIKLSESAAKHNISLRFFKLALEAGCEPLQRMRDELKAYVRRHNLAEFGETPKELFKNYNILENLEPQVSETISQVYQEGTRSSDDDARSFSSVTGASKLKPTSLEIDATSAKASSPVAKLGKKNATPKDNSVPKIRKSVNIVSGSENVRQSITKKSQKPTKKDLNLEMRETEKHENKVFHEQGPTDLPVDEPLQENKENTDSPRMEETSLIDV